MENNNQPQNSKTQKGKSLVKFIRGAYQEGRSVRWTPPPSPEVRLEEEKQPEE